MERGYQDEAKGVGQDHPAQEKGSGAARRSKDRQKDSPGSDQEGKKRALGSVPEKSGGRRRLGGNALRQVAEAVHGTHDIPRGLHGGESRG